MGIHRLWSHIKRNKNTVVSYVDLVDLAKQYPGGLKILVDFYSWEHFMVAHFWQSVSQLYDNKNLIFCGGEYSMIDSFIKDFIMQLKSVNIILEFFLDGAKGSSYECSKQKMKTWESRFYEDQTRLRKTINFLRGMIPYDEVDLHHLTRPCLQEVQNVLTLQECGCTIHLQVSGEADHVIAEHMQTDPAAFAVLSNDTDLCIFENSVLMPFDYFDMDNCLGLGLESLSLRRPEKLRCGVVKTESVIALLDLPDHTSLIEFAVIAGNDFTLPFLQNVPSFKTAYMGHMNKLANLINRCGVAERCPFFAQLINHNSGLRDAIAHSREFYTLRLKSEKDEEKNFIYSLIAQDIKKGSLPSTIIAMHQGVYWHRQVLEDPSPGLITAELALSDFRAHVYAILLPQHIMSVTEIGRTPDKLVREIVVMKVIDPRIPNFANVKRCSFSKKMQVFELILQHQEPSEFLQEKSYFKLYGLREGFMCFLLRYFLLLNWGKNLYLSMEEFFVTFAWLYSSRSKDTNYQHLKIVPSPRCVTVENFFLALYRNVYAFLGNILSLSHEFPAPRDLFSGGNWVALYTASAVFDPNPLTREPPPRSVSVENLRKINSKVKQTVASNRHIVKNIIKGLFYFE